MYGSASLSSLSTIRGRAKWRSATSGSSEWRSVSQGTHHRHEPSGCASRPNLPRAPRSCYLCHAQSPSRAGGPRSLPARLFSCLLAALPCGGARAATRPRAPRASAPSLPGARRGAAAPASPNSASGGEDLRRDLGPTLGERGQPHRLGHPARRHRPASTMHRRRCPRVAPRLRASKLPDPRQNAPSRGRVPLARRARSHPRAGPHRSAQSGLADLASKQAGWLGRTAACEVRPRSLRRRGVPRYGSARHGPETSGRARERSSPQRCRRCGRHDCREELLLRA
jgi:hypothetical protein